MLRETEGKIYLDLEEDGVEESDVFKCLMKILEHLESEDIVRWPGDYGHNCTIWYDSEYNKVAEIDHYTNELEVVDKYVLC